MEMDAKYTAEKNALFAEIRELEQTVTNYNNHQKYAEKFVALVDRYQGFEELTITILNEFIDKILVHESDEKGRIDTTQEVDIFFNFVGQYVPPHFDEPLTPEEEEERRQHRERCEKFHRAYLQRKASGTQKRYEDKVKAAKKAKIDAQKAAIRAEDMANGVFVLDGQLRGEPKKPHESKGNA